MRERLKALERGRFRELEGGWEWEFSDPVNFYNILVVFLKEQITVEEENFYGGFVRDFGHDQVEDVMSLVERPCVVES
jgi:hypothetical protein